MSEFSSNPVMILQFFCFSCMDRRIQQVEDLGFNALRQVDEGNWVRLDHIIESGCTRCGGDAQFKIYQTAI